MATRPDVVLADVRHSPGHDGSGGADRGTLADVTSPNDDPQSPEQEVWLDDSVVEISLPSDPIAARTARSYVHEKWPQLAEETLDDVSLIVSELVSNAVQHGEPEIGLRMRVEPFAVDVAVLDHGSGIPAKLDLDQSATHGRGLQLIDSLARRWGVANLDDGSGKYVWATMPNG